MNRSFMYLLIFLLTSFYISVDLSKLIILLCHTHIMMNYSVSKLAEQNSWSLLSYISVMTPFVHTSFHHYTFHAYNHTKIFSYLHRPGSQIKHF